jgi:D-alanyl-lipoteichoic acid acyltransferase DltB (MBOAT superfamily)
MLFTSYPFIFVFLPVTLALVLGLSAIGQRLLAKVALFVASLCFYGWWSIRYVPLLLFLVAANFAIAKALLATLRDAPPWRRWLLVAGIALNVAVLGYYKYTNFFLDTVSAVSHHDFRLSAIVLPLGLSFIVFQKIGLLVDVYSGEVDHLPLEDYALFVTFFPQLIAGPIVHHRDVIPQFGNESSLRFRWRSMAVGVAFFVLGAFKKVAIADSLDPHASAMFVQAEVHGEGLAFLAAWLGALSYLLQLYFDFSGYSDMAMGLAAMFNIQLPANFDSPFKAASMIDFWKRWHISLSKFLNAYIYNPVALSISRRRAAAGSSRAHALSWRVFAAQVAWPTMLTMTVAGVWHGAGWQFIVFGVFHGLCIVVNHAWALRRKRQKKKGPSPRWWHLGSRVLTVGAVTYSMIFFRATSLRSALHITAAMTGAHGRLGTLMLTPTFGALLVGALLWTQIMPNTVEWIGPLSDTEPREPSRWPGFLAAWRPDVRTGLLVGAVAAYVLTAIARPVAFLYFRF